MVPVQAVCNTILKKSFEEAIPVSPMKLQKILYFVYRDYLQRTQQRLFIENFQPWQYGPVLSSIYDEFKSFKAHAITKFAKNANGDVLIVNETAAPEIMKSIQDVWNLTKHQSGTHLSSITHRPGTAWDKALRKGLPVLEDSDIANDREAIG